MEWPGSAAELRAEQVALAALAPPAWRLFEGAAIGGCFVCFPRRRPGPGAAGDAAWAGAAVVDPHGAVDATTAVVAGAAGAPYVAGLLALREGPLLAAAVDALPAPPDVLLVNATGLDHPRGAGLALHLGAVLGLPSVGVTHRPLAARGEGPALRRGVRRPLLLDGRQVGALLCTRNGCRALAIHAAWRTATETAVAVVLAAGGGARTPEPLRRARQAARAARAAAARTAREGEWTGGGS